MVFRYMVEKVVVDDVGIHDLFIINAVIENCVLKWSCRVCSVECAVLLLLRLWEIQRIKELHSYN